MSKSLKIILLSVIGFMGLLILIAAALYFVDTSVYTSRLERAASESLGLEIRVGGRLGIAFFGDLHVRLDDVHIRNREMDIASAEQASLEIALFPLLHKEVRIKRIGLQRPRITITRDRDGTFNFEKRKKSKQTRLPLAPDNLFISDGFFLYGDDQSGKGIEVEHFNLDVRSLGIAGGNSAELLKNLSFTAEFACREIRTKGLTISNAKFTCRGKDGVFALTPVTMGLFGGQGSGSIGVDFTDPVPRYSVRLSLSKFKIEEYLKTYFSKKVAQGSMDCSATLSMRGNTAKELKQTAEGAVTLRGENLTLYGHDLDREFARFESSQNFKLVDAGAFFFAGPLGLAVTKGYNFASIFQGSGGSSSIEKLSSSWKVERGIAQAMDVAMATKENRIALKGRINFVDERFDDVIIALIDARGCARVQQKIRGPFRKPVVEKPNVLMSLAGPALNLFKQARNLFTGEKCKAFYTGSVRAPK
ncbi:MAG: AsmA family protein [Deltaproteobacteria bacterium]|nr:AsmA family protein [Deltaproteobacteria bacterium]